MPQTNFTELELQSENTKNKFNPKRFLKNLQRKIFKSQYSYLAFCFLVPIALMYGIYIVKGIYPFGEYSPLVLDLNAQYVSFFEATRDFILGDRSALYSFSRSLGGEFMGMIAYYTASPLTLITVLFPIERIQEAILTILLIKCGLSGLTFGFYLHKKSRNPNRLIIFSFSMMYALTAYAIVHQHNTMWIDAVIWLPLLALGIENLVYRKKCFLYVISLSVIMISNYYIGFMICIFSVLYYFFCYYSKSKEELNPYNERFHFVRTGLRFSLYSILAAAIGAFMLIAAYYSLKFGKTEFSSPNWDMQAKFDIVDFLVKLLPGSYDTVEPAGIPFVYCGLLTIILVPIYFISKKISLREKICSFALVTVFLFSFIVKPLDLIWHGFSNPNWLNGRYSFMFCFILLVLAYKAIGNLKGISEKMILAVAGIIALFTVIVQKLEFKTFITSSKKLLTFQCIWFSIAFTVVIAIILCVWMKLRKSKNSHTKAVTAILVSVICLELFCNGAVCVLYLHKDVTYTKYANVTNHLANYRPIVNEIKESDPGFYRMEKTYHRTKNDNMALQMYGLTNSTSTLNKKAIDLVGQLGYVGRSHGTMYRGGTAVGDSLLGIKYVIDDKDHTTFNGIYEPVKSLSTDAYTVYKNPNALSIAYGVSSNIKDVDLSKYTLPTDRYNALLAAMLGKEEGSVELFKYVECNDLTSQNCKESGGASFYKVFEANSNDDVKHRVTYKYSAPADGYYYFYTKGSTTKDLEITITNYPTTRTYLTGDYNHLIIGGFFKQGEDITVNITIPTSGKFTITDTSKNLAYFSVDEYNEIFAQLKAQPQFNIDKDYTEDHLTGKITTAESKQTVLTTIPYDEGWNVYVDGKKVKTYETLDALMAFDITGAGTHELEMKYMPQKYIIGAIISIIGTLTFIGVIIFTIVWKKISKKTQRIYEADYFILSDFDEPDEITSNEDNGNADAVPSDAPQDTLAENIQNDESHADDQTPTATDNEQDTLDTNNEETQNTSDSVTEGIEYSHYYHPYTKD